MYLDILIRLGVNRECVRQTDGETGDRRTDRNKFLSQMSRLTPTNKWALTYAGGSIHWPSVTHSMLTETLKASHVREFANHTCNNADHRCKFTCNHMTGHTNSHTAKRCSSKYTVSVLGTCVSHYTSILYLYKH